jgi:hypothetical protein
MRTPTDLDPGRATRPQEAHGYDERAAAIWPRLDRRVLSRYAWDAERLAAHIARRTSLPPEAIISILTRSEED